MTVEKLNKLIKQAKDVIGDEQDDDEGEAAGRAKRREPTDPRRATTASANTVGPEAI